MSKIRWMQLLVLALLGFPATGCVEAPEPGDNVNGTWRAKLTRDDEGIRLTLNVRQDDSRWSTTRYVSLDELDGFDEKVFRRVGADVRMSWPVEAGVVHFEGKGGWLFRPSGTFEFEPDPDYVARLGELGYDSVSQRDLLFAFSDSDAFELIREVNELGYADASLNDILRLANHGVTPDYLAAAQALGGHPPLDEVRRLRNHGVPAEVLRRYEVLGLAPLPAESVLRLHSHGVPAEYAAEVASGPLEGSEVEKTLRLHRHGLTVDYVNEARQAGLADAADEGIIRMSRHGVRSEDLPQWVACGVDDVEDIVRLTSHGVRPRVAAELHEAGLESPSAEDLIRLQQHGVDGPFVRRLSESGQGPFSVEELIEIKNRGIEDFLTRRRDS